MHSDVAKAFNIAIFHVWAIIGVVLLAFAAGPAWALIPAVLIFIMAYVVA